MNTTKVPRLRAEASLPFLVRELGLDPDSVPGGIRLDPNLLKRRHRFAETFGVTFGKRSKYAWIVFDLGFAAVPARPLRIALLMGVIVHEFMHVEGGTERVAFFYERQFYLKAYLSGFITLDELTALLKNWKVNRAYEVKGRKDTDEDRRGCPECAKYGLDPNGWSPIGHPGRTPIPGTSPPP